MLRFERREDGTYKTELYKTINTPEAVEMLAGFEDVFTLDENNTPVKFELFDDFQEKSINNFGDLLNLKFYKKIETKKKQNNKMELIS